MPCLLGEGSEFFEAVDDHPSLDETSVFCPFLCSSKRNFGVERGFFPFIYAQAVCSVYAKILSSIVCILGL